MPPAPLEPFPKRHPKKSHSLSPRGAVKGSNKKTGVLGVGIKKNTIPHVPTP